jgi:IclR family pca regulon transcriptional regulator
MAALADHQVLDILARSDRRKLTPRTTVDIDEIVQDVARARDMGYATSLE